MAELIAKLTPFEARNRAALRPIVNAEAYVIALQEPAAGTVQSPSASRSAKQWASLLFGASEGASPSPGASVRVGRPKATPSRANSYSVPRGHGQAARPGRKERWGLPIVLAAAIFGFHLLYAVALLAGATTMRPIWFGLTVPRGPAVPLSRCVHSRPGRAVHLRRRRQLAAPRRIHSAIRASKQPDTVARSS